LSRFLGLSATPTLAFGGDGPPFSHFRAVRAISLRGRATPVLGNADLERGHLARLRRAALDVYNRTHSSVWVGALLVTETLPIALARLPLRAAARSSAAALSDDRRGSLSHQPSSSLSSSRQAPGRSSALATLAGIATGPVHARGLRGACRISSRNRTWRRQRAIPDRHQRDDDRRTALRRGHRHCRRVSPGLPPQRRQLRFRGDNGRRHSPSGLQSITAASRGYLRDLLDGAGAVFRSRPLLTVFVAWNVAGDRDRRDEHRRGRTGQAQLPAPATSATDCSRPRRASASLSAPSTREQYSRRDPSQSPTRSGSRCSRPPWAWSPCFLPSRSPPRFSCSAARATACSERPTRRSCSKARAMICAVAPSC